MSCSGVGTRSRSQSKSGRLTPSVYCRIFSCGKKKKKSSTRSKCGGKSRGRSRRRSRRKKSVRKKSCRKKSRRKKSRRKKSRRKKCRPGIETTNPFLNYLRVFRKKHCGWPACKIAIEGAKCWCKMNEIDRKKFYDQALSQKKSRKQGRTKRKRKGRKRKGRGGRCGRKRRGRSRKRRARSRRKRKGKGTCPK